MRTLEIKAGTYADPLTWNVDALYSRCGLLAIHKALPDCAETGWQRADGWRITHVGTGLSIGSRSTRSEALAIRKALEAIPRPIGSNCSPWDFASADRGILSALRDSVYRACESVDGKGLHV